MGSGRTGWVALAIAVAGSVAVMLPGTVLYLGLGLALFAFVAGVVAFRRRADRGGARLAGVAAAAVAGLALALGVVRYAMIVAGLDRLESLFS